MEKQAVNKALDKVSDLPNRKIDTQSAESALKAFSEERKEAKPAQIRIKIKDEHTRLIMREFELDRAKAEEKLRSCEGDVVRTLISLVES